MPDRIGNQFNLELRLKYVYEQIQTQNLLIIYLFDQIQINYNTQKFK